MNVAYHLTQLGVHAKVVSAVGTDELGRRAIKEFKEKGMDTSFVACTDYETGRANIVLIGNNADYTFNEDNAWDHIPLPEIQDSNVDIIYYGTLAQRNEESRNTIYSILEQVKAKHIFFDVNIRKHFYTKEIVKRGIKFATILKLNEEELPLIADILGVKSEGKKAAEELLEMYGLELLLLTEGKKGTSLYDGDKWYHQGIEDVVVADTVGAGDSLSAGFLATLLKSGDKDKALRIGGHLADYVVSQRGATPDYPGALNSFLKRENVI